MYDSPLGLGECLSSSRPQFSASRPHDLESRCCLDMETMISDFHHDPSVWGDVEAISDPSWNCGGPGTGSARGGCNAKT